MSSKQLVDKCLKQTRQRRATSGMAVQTVKRRELRGRGESTRQMIVEVGRRLMSEHGLGGTALADIQAATGLSKGAFYHHFRSKEDVALAVVAAAAEEYEKHCLEPVSRLEGPGARVAGLLERIIALNEQPTWRNCRLLATLMGELSGYEGRLGEAVLELRRRLVEGLASAIAAAQQAHQCEQTIHATVAAEWILCTVCGWSLARKAGATDMGLRQLVGALRQVLLKPGTEGY